MNAFAAPPFRLTVGPLLYYWPRATVLAFYTSLMDAPVHTVHLGEVVCSRRHELKVDDWLALGRDLAEAGKEVVLSGQALIESDAELRLLHRLTDNGEFLVEANEAAALHRLAGRPFVIGPHVNVYSAPALDALAELGAVRWVPPVEMPLDAMPSVNPPDRTPAVETEVFAFGRLPLAFSARCFTARHYAVNRDECGFRCIEHPDGLTLNTQDGEPFLALNGLQTQSARVQNLLGWRNALAQAGVLRVRLSPVARHFDQVIDAFDAVLNQGADAHAALVGLCAAGLPGAPADGYVRGRAGFEWRPA
jgi:O2-independent ubiquinone biosynthesis protein UbiV